MVFDLPHSAENMRNSEGSFIKLKDGSIMFVYTRYRAESSHDHGSADLCKITSRDGENWSTPEVLVKNRGKNVMSASLLRLQDGRIALSYARKSAIDSAINDYVVDCRAWITFSEDEGRTWSEEMDITGVPCCYHVVNNDRLIQLASGRLLLPVAEHRLKRDTIDLRGTVYFYLSDDGGKNWREAAERHAAPKWMTSGFQEPLAVELKDGRIMAYFRTDSGCHWKACSVDGGEHWSEAQMAPEFKAPNSPLSIKRDPVSGDLLAVWNDHDPVRSVKYTPASWQRTPLVIARSNDETASWHGHQILENEPDHGYCYTAMLFDGDFLYLAYCCGGGDAQVLQDLRIRKLALKDTAG